MTSFGIVADIHGNLDALRAATTALQERGIERILCLGDIVGYNADSNECARLVRDGPFEAITGNHELIALGRLGFDRCAPKPEFALRRTRRALSAESRDFLSALPGTRVVEGEIALIHGGVDDASEYLISAAHVAANEALLARRHPAATICFFGHTHAPKIYEVNRGIALERDPAGRVELGGGGRRYFINPGSIDAARKSGEKLAEYAIFDSERRSVELHRAAYDHLRAERRAAEEGYRMTPADEWMLRLRRAGRRWVRASRFAWK